MTCDRHPLVLFIDDIQWMDDGSRQLIKTLLQDAELMNVVLIFAYREEEQDAIGDLFSRDSGEYNRYCRQQSQREIRVTNWYRVS
jgi:predicted ATPase